MSVLNTFSSGIRAAHTLSHICTHAYIIYMHIHDTDTFINIHFYTACTSKSVLCKCVHVRARIRSRTCAYICKPSLNLVLNLSKPDFKVCNGVILNFDKI